MNPLIIYLEPKSGLSEVKRELKKIPCDIICLKYMKYPDVYKVALRTVKSHSEYTHIVWVQNDIIFNKEAFFKLCKGIKSIEGSILGASMNIDLSHHGLKKCAYTTEPFLFNETNGFIDKDPPYRDKGIDRGIIPIFHNGGVFICTREFYLRFPLRGFKETGYNADLVHGIEINANQEKYYLDTSIHLKHLRYQGKMQVGKKPIEVEFIEF